MRASAGMSIANMEQNRQKIEREAASATVILTTLPKNYFLHHGVSGRCGRGGKIIRVYAGKGLGKALGEVCSHFFERTGRVREAGKHSTL
jgi:hypothetical protein